MDERTPIIIKKIKKNRTGHHGGSWKVAYADFMTAMMAFFLLLWLITMVSPEKRLAVSEYFKHYNIFKEHSAAQGRSMMDKSPGSLAQLSPRTKEGANNLALKMKQAMDQKLRRYRNQVSIDIVDGGVRIQIIDMEGSQMFPSASAEPTEKAREIIGIVAENIKDIPNRIAVEGHTDSSPFRGSQITNWELSTARASAARRELENDGIEPSSIARVVGYADQDLFVKENPHDPRNRRISIIVLQPQADLRKLLK